MKNNTNGMEDVHMHTYHKHFVRYVMFLNQVCAGLAASAHLFLINATVRECLYACVFVYVSAPKAINVIETP